LAGVRAVVVARATRFLPSKTSIGARGGVSCCSSPLLHFDLITATSLTPLLTSFTVHASTIGVASQRRQTAALRFCAVACPASRRRCSNLELFWAYFLYLQLARFHSTLHRYRGDCIYASRAVAAAHRGSPAGCGSTAACSTSYITAMFVRVAVCMLLACSDCIAAHSTAAWQQPSPLANMLPAALLPATQTACIVLTEGRPSPCIPAGMLHASHACSLLPPPQCIPLHDCRVTPTEGRRSPCRPIASPPRARPPRELRGWRGSLTHAEHAGAWGGRGG
jgi:hypothetical protein